MVKTILAMGQSNAVGRSGPTLVANERSFVWNNQNDIDTTANVGTAFVAPNVAANPYVNGKGNFLTSTAAYLARMLEPDEDVRIILVAMGGLSIDSWINASNVKGAMWTRMKAVLAAAGVTQVDAFLWHQGENDEATYTTYSTRFNYLLNALQTDGHITATTPVVIGECMWGVPNINGALHAIADTNARVEIVNIGAYHSLDGVHFNDMFTPVIAVDYARALSRLDGAWKDKWRVPDVKNNPPVVANPVTNGFKLVKPEDLVTQRNFIYCAGAAVSLPTGVDTIVPLRHMFGDRGYLSSGGFSPNGREGIWRFDLQGFGSGGITRVKLVDYSGKELAFVAYSGGADLAANNPIIHGFTFLRLFRSDRVFMSVNQAGGATQNINEITSNAYNRFGATFMGED